jgi:hypothetical protein
MLDPYHIRELSLERQRAMIEWREQQRQFERLGLHESPLKGLVNAIIRRLETLNHPAQPEVQAQPRTEQRRREA